MNNKMFNELVASIREAGAIRREIAMRERLGTQLLRLAMWLLEPYWVSCEEFDLDHDSYPFGELIKDQLAYDEAIKEFDKMLAQITPEKRHPETKW